MKSIPEFYESAAMFFVGVAIGGFLNAIAIDGLAVGVGIVGMIISFIVGWIVNNWGKFK